MSEQRTALVTGATSGIGRAAAIALAEAGWWVAAHGRDHERGREVAELLGERGTFLAADLAERGAPARIVEQVVAERGRLDLLVNNAALYGRDSAGDLRDEQLEAILITNLHAAILAASAAVRVMREQGSGVIVNVSSEAGLVAIPGQVAYNVSKAGLNMLTKSIAVDHAADGIRAVSICPGTTWTPLVDAAVQADADPEAYAQRLAGSRPLGRLGRPEEIAAAVVFAASDEAGFMTGTDLVLDGGYTAG